MIVKILNKSSSTFSAVRYNDNKVEKGTGELMAMLNFPAHLTPASSQGEVRDYFQSIQNKRIQNKQFHATISAEGRGRSKEVLTEMAQRYMDKMGYGQQPYIVVFHNDTSNNHVHVVSTRIDKETQGRINQDFEQYRSLSAMREIMKEMYGVDHESKIDKLLSYSFSNTSQLNKLLQSSGLDSYTKDDRLYITQYGQPLKSIGKDEINFTNDRDAQRKKQVYSILKRFAEKYSNKVFRVKDEQSGKIEYTSQLQKELRDRLGVDLIFSQTGDKQPFGYTIVDHKTKAIYKGGEIMKMGNLFNFTDETINKVFFDLLTNYNVTNQETKQALIHYLGQNLNSDIQDFMVFGNNSKVPYKIYDETKQLAVNYIRNHERREYLQDKIDLFQHEGKHYLVNKAEGKLFDLEKLVGENNYLSYQLGVSSVRVSEGLQQENNNDNLITQETSNSSTLAELLNPSVFLDSTGLSTEDEEENERKRKRKRKRKRR